MPHIKKLQIKELAQMFLPVITRRLDVGFIGEGCYSFAQAVHLAFPETSRTVLAISADGEILHSLIKVVDEDLYGDANGWQSFESLKRSYFAREGVLISDCVEVSFSKPLNDSSVILHYDVINEISDHIKNEYRIYFDLPIEGHEFIRVECGLFDKGSAGVTSDIVPDCEGVYGGFVDGIESLVLGHFCAGVDVTTHEYCQGVNTALQAAEANLPDCHCNVCVNSD